MSIHNDDPRFTIRKFSEEAGDVILPETG